MFHWKEFNLAIKLEHCFSPGIVPPFVVISFLPLSPLPQVWFREPFKIYNKIKFCEGLLIKPYWKINFFLLFTSCSWSNFFCAASNCTCLLRRAWFSLSRLASSSCLLSLYHSSLFWSFSACFSSKSFNFCWAVSSKAWISSIIPEISL